MNFKYFNLSPNLGFVQQLKLFEIMNFKVDKDSIAYKTFKLDNLNYIFNFGIDSKFLCLITKSIKL